MLAKKQIIFEFYTEQEIHKEGALFLISGSVLILWMDFKLEDHWCALKMPAIILWEYQESWCLSDCRKF